MDEEFVRKTIAFKGAEGQKWLDSIPDLIKQYEKKWSISVFPPFNLSFNYVAPATRGSESVALKIGVPGVSEFWSELEALKIFAGNGSCKLLEVDEENRVLLIERVLPGVPVSEIEDDDEATKILASIMKKLWHEAPVEHTLPTLSGSMKGFDRYRTMFAGKGPLPEKITEEAEDLYQSLVNNSQEAYVLHGDLHHYNVLSATREPYLAIDPHGVVGERAYETAAVLRNPQKRVHSSPDIKKFLERRINILSSELEIEKERIRQWGVAQSVLSAIWKIEDGGTDWNYCIATAEALSSLKF